MSRKLIMPIFMLSMFVVVGCGGPDIKDINQRIIDLNAVARKNPNATYVVEAPDQLRIEAAGLPELTREVTVRQDGCITMPLLQDIKIGGKTPVEIKKLLEEKYAKYYTDVGFIVTVTAYRSKRVFVYGEVARPAGAIPYTGDMTVSDVIGQVGGFTHRASPTRVVVARQDLKKPARFRVDLRKLLYRGDARENVLLSENDVIYVPPNWLAWIGYKLDLILWPLRGAQSGITTSEGIAGTN